MHDALNDKGELKNHVLHPKADALVSDRRYKEPKIGKQDKYIGEGAFNEVHARRFKADRTSSLKAFLGIGRVKTRVVKESKPLTMTITDRWTGLKRQQGHPHAMQTGIDYNTPRVADRNVAARTSDKHLGLDIAPKASAGIFDGKPCLAMKLAPGRTCAAEYIDHPEMILDPEFQHQMSDAEVSAFASGHTDPHMSNVMVHRAEKKSLIGGEAKVTYKVTLIDNDTCHSPKFNNPDKPPLMDAAFPIQFRSTGLPAYMDTATARKVEKLDLMNYAKDLRKNLTEDEVKCSCDRMQLLKNHIGFLRTENRIVKDWKAFTNESGKACAGKSVIEGTLAMPGVQQGFKSNGEPHIVPRSMFLRDVQDAAVGRHKVVVKNTSGALEKKSPAFRAALSPQLYSDIIAFDRPDMRLMPPSGDPGQHRRLLDASPSRGDVPQSPPISSSSDAPVGSQASELYSEDVYGNSVSTRPSSDSEDISVDENTTLVSTRRSSDSEGIYNNSVSTRPSSDSEDVSVDEHISPVSNHRSSEGDNGEIPVASLDGDGASALGRQSDSREDMLAHIRAQRDSTLLA